MTSNLEKLGNNAKYDNRTREVSQDDTCRERDRHQQSNTRFASYEDIKASVSRITLSGAPALWRRVQQWSRPLPNSATKSIKSEVPAAAKIFAFHDSMAINQLLGFSEH